MVGYITFKCLWDGSYLGREMIKEWKQPSFILRFQEPDPKVGLNQTKYKGQLLIHVFANAPLLFIFFTLYVGVAIKERLIVIFSCKFLSCLISFVCHWYFFIPLLIVCWCSKTFDYFPRQYILPLCSIHCTTIMYIYVGYQWKGAGSPFSIWFSLYDCWLRMWGINEGWLVVMTPSGEKTAPQQQNWQRGEGNKRQQKHRRT